MHYLGFAVGQIPRPRKLSMLEIQLQDPSVCKHTGPYTHNVVDRRSGDSSLNFIDNLMTSQSIERRSDILPIMKCFNAKIASALKKLS